MCGLLYSAGLLCFMAKPLAFVILCGLCSWKNIHGEHGWHRILKYNYSLHVQIFFILQSLKCISRMSQGFSQYPASVRTLPLIILVFLPILATLDLSKSFQRPGKLYYVTVYYAVIWVVKIPLSLSRWCSFCRANALASCGT